jgi:hypothetical protein
LSSPVLSTSRPAMKSLGAEIDEIVEAPPPLALDFSMPGM